ncbi:DEAD/DEAH box helicase [Paenibacillus lentus]|uniref:DEAD/DEAH box helicase n=1 Tax=Paenibacillus lentus TaxID=1338368 RepID=A0A3Q8SDN9_9BACL|nr:DEAD/DEAH box helicase [Paenibacillus lentus]AZK48385.1 DEAD/DEAH box helicase [Paenibacillus lentus]
MNTISFAGLGIEEPLLSRLADFGISEPSPVQAESIPAALSGRDVLAQSQTGTGKTLAYLLPVLQQMNPEEKALQGVILAPTQELAMQIYREAEKYGEPLGVGVQALIGGAAIKRQLERLRQHPQLVVGTPGRIREIQALRKIKLHTVRTVVVDEVDQMFQLGGTADVEHILRGTLRERQLMFLSATINEEIRSLAAKEMKDPVEIGIEPEQRTAKSLEHIYFITEERDKIDMLRRVIRHYDPARTIVFINHTDHISEVEAKMNYLGLHAGALYGDADKTVRAATLRRFREGKIRVLVASDIAARGLDIEDLDLVVNLDPPPDTEHYVHRVGRTARMGRKGLAVSIISAKEQFIIRKFSRELRIQISLREMYAGNVIKPDSVSSGRRKAVKGAGRASEGRSATASKSSSHQVTSGQGLPRKGAENKAGISTAASGSRSVTKRLGPGSVKGDNRTSKKNDQDRKNKGAPRWLKDKQNKG